VTKLGFGVSDVVLSIGNIIVLWTEVWDKVILFESLWLLERGLQLVLELILGISDVALGLGDIN
jgi:hypothetical protein